MKTKTFQTLLPMLIILVFICSCASHPIEEKVNTINPSSVSIKLTTSTPKGLAIRETKRVGTVFALQTASATPLPSPLPTITLTPAPTSTPKSFSSNDVLVSYIRYSGDGADELTSCLNAYSSYNFVLYRNGRLIVFDKSRYLETQINQAEIAKLLTEFDKTGFSLLNGDGDQYKQNASTPAFSNGRGSTITLRGKSISIDDMQSNNVVESIVNTLDIIANYRPKDLRTYIPETIAFFIFPEGKPEFEVFQSATTAPILNWSVDSINLYNMANDPLGQQPYYVTGHIVSFLVQQLKVIPSFGKVKQNGQSYLVLACPNFAP